MPVYEFECASCKHQFEVFCKNYEESFGEKCPKCDSSILNRIISKSSFILKGTGWSSSVDSGLKT